MKLVGRDETASTLDGVMARFRIFDLALSSQGSEANTCTLGQVCWAGAGKAMDMVGIVAAPVTLRVIIRATLLTVITAEDQAFKGMLELGSMLTSVPYPEPEPMCLIERRELVGANQTPGRRLPAPSCCPVAVMWTMLVYPDEETAAVGIRSKLTV